MPTYISKCSSSVRPDVRSVRSGRPDVSLTQAWHWQLSVPWVEIGCVFVRVLIDYFYRIYVESWREVRCVFWDSIMYLPACVYACACIHTYPHVKSHTHTHTHSHGLVQQYIYIYIYIHVCSNTHTHTCTDTHAHNLSLSHTRRY